MSKFKVGDTVKLIRPETGIGDYAEYLSGVYAIVTNSSPLQLNYVEPHTQFNKRGYFVKEEWFASVNIYSKDNVNSPAHYSKNHIGIECINAMEAMLTPEEFLGYLRGNMFKYAWRFRYKNGAEDVAKHKWYTDKLNEHLTKYPELAKGEK